MEQEQRFLQALQGVERWDISPIEQMRFWPAKASRCVGGWKRVNPLLLLRLPCGEDLSPMGASALRRVGKPIRGCAAHG
jgi:hypothetical protein